MAVAEIDALKKVRNVLVTSRRKLVAKINAPGAVLEAPELVAYVEQITKLPAGIEALDRAIRDEGGLASGASLALAPVR